jgi:hypothetical protein
MLTYDFQQRREASSVGYISSLRFISEMYEFMRGTWDAELLMIQLLRQWKCSEEGITYDYWCNSYFVPP